MVCRADLLLLRADPEFDELRWSVGGSSLDLADVSSYPFLTQLLGAQVMWTWQLINQQGYTDGIQLDFRSGDKVISPLQIMVWGSSLSFYRVDKLALP